MATAMLITIIIVVVAYLYQYGTKPFFSPFDDSRVIFYEKSSIGYADDLTKNKIPFTFVTFHIDDIVSKYPHHLIERVSISNDTDDKVKHLISQKRGFTDPLHPYIKLAELAAQYGIEIEVVCDVSFRELISTYLRNGKLVDVIKDDPVSLFEPLRFITK